MLKMLGFFTTSTYSKVFRSTDYKLIGSWSAKLTVFGFILWISIVFFFTLIKIICDSSFGFLGLFFFFLRFFICLFCSSATASWFLVMTASAKEGVLGGLGSTSMLGLAVVVNALDPWRNHPLVSTFKIF